MLRWYKKFLVYFDFLPTNVTIIDRDEFPNFSVIIELHGNQYLKEYIS